MKGKPLLKRSHRPTRQDPYPAYTKGSFASVQFNSSHKSLVRYGLLPTATTEPIHQHWAEQPYGYERYRTERIEIDAILTFGDIIDGRGKPITRPMSDIKPFVAATADLSGIDLMHLIREGRLAMKGADQMSAAKQS